CEFPPVILDCIDYGYIARAGRLTGQKDNGPAVRIDGIIECAKRHSCQLLRTALESGPVDVDLFWRLIALCRIPCLTMRGGVRGLCWSSSVCSAFIRIVRIVILTFECDRVNLYRGSVTATASTKSATLVANKEQLTAIGTEARIDVTI